jgi:hypothetical protein
VYILTRVTYASIDDFINRAQPTLEEGFEYRGPLAECKKGREELKKSTDAGLADTKSAQDIAGNADKIAASEVNTNGGLSPLVAKQLAGEQGMIGKTYADASRAADRGLSMRGMGVAPSGLSASIKNTGINNAGEAETGAVGNAFGMQNQLNNSAYTQPLNALGVANGGVGASTNAATALNKAGSTLGDIGSGLSGLAGIGSSLFGAGGMFGKGSKLGGG